MARRGRIRFTTHPGPERDLYVEIGEVELLSRKRASFLDTLGRDRGRYAVHVWNWLAAATVVYVPFSLKEQGHRDANPSRFIWYTGVVHPLPLVAVLVLLLALGHCTGTR